jgi:hypothetical protein
MGKNPNLVVNVIIKQIGIEMDKKEHLKALEELKKLRKPIHNVNLKHKESLSALEKIAVKYSINIYNILK